MKGLHIVVDVSPISFLQGRGFRRHVLSLLNALREDKNPNRYSFLSLDKAIDPFFPRNDSRFRLERPRRRIPMLHRSPSWTGWLGKLLLSDVDVVHFPCSDIWCGPPRIRTVVTIHDFAPLYFPERFFKNSGEEKRYRFLLDRIAENTTLLITVSNHTRDEALKYLGVEPERLRTVYNAVDPLFLKKAVLPSGEEMERLGFGKPFFLFVGALDFRKNIPLLIEAFSWYRARGGNLNLVLVGRQDARNTTYYPPIQPLLEKSKYKKHIFWLRNIPDPWLPKIYSRATALLFPSSFEGFGYPLVEAMACETPIIATRTSCLAEIAGDAALFVKPTVDEIGEAMRRMEGDDPLGRRLKELGKQRLGLFLPGRLAREMIEVYHQASSREGFQSSNR